MSEQRRQFILGAEGAALAMVQQAGTERAADHIRWHIDGWVNALIRIEGAEATSRFLFALSDRAAGGLREPTEFQPLAPPVAIAEAQKAPAAGKSGRFGGYWWGYAAGLITALFIAAARA